MQDVEQVALEFLRRAAEEEHVHLQTLYRYDSKPVDKTQLPCSLVGRSGVVDAVVLVQGKCPFDAYHLEVEVCSVIHCALVGSG